MSPRAAMPWFRFYVEAIYDRKLRRLSASHRWLWVVVLAMARQSPVSGVLLVGACQPVEDEDLADAAAMRPGEVTAGLAAFVDAGMIHRDEEHCAWRVTKWAERQFESDDVNARSRRLRSGRSNSDATLHATTLQRCNPVASNGDAPFDATAPDTETENYPPHPPLSGGNGSAPTNPRALGTNPRGRKPLAPEEAAVVAFQARLDRSNAERRARDEEAARARRESDPTAAVVALDEARAQITGREP